MSDIDPFKENENLYRDHRSDIPLTDTDKKRYSISKTWKWNWDDVLEKLFKKIFRKKRR